MAAGDQVTLDLHVNRTGSNYYTLAAIISEENRGRREHQCRQACRLRRRVFRRRPDRRDHHGSRGQGRLKEISR